MKILLTGYKGFIGSNFVKALDSYEVDLFEWGDHLPNVENYDWVLHIGAISSTTESNIEKLMAQNYEFSIDLYNQCRFYGVNFQFSSSASVYGLKTEFKETSPVDPKNPYAWSKYMVELHIKRNMPNNSVAQIFRYFNVYGPGEEQKDQPSPFTVFKRQVETQGYINLFEGSENYLRDFIPVETVIDIQKNFLDIPDSGIYNVGTGKTMSFLDVANTFNVPIKTIPMPEVLKASYQKYTCADMTKTYSTLKELYANKSRTT